MDDGYSVKFMLMGEKNSGKSTFVKYYKDGTIYSGDIGFYLPTVIIEYTRIYIEFYNKKLILHFFDPSQVKQNHLFIKTFTRDSAIIFIFYDSTDRESFQKAKELFDMVKSVINKSEIIYVLISSKYDLYIKSAENTNKVPEEEALEFASKNNILFAHLSIAEKYSNGIIELMDKVLKEYFKRNKVIW